MITHEQLMLAMCQTPNYLSGKMINHFEDEYNIKGLYEYIHIEFLHKIEKGYYIEFNTNVITDMDLFKTIISQCEEDGIKPIDYIATLTDKTYIGIRVK